MFIKTAFLLAFVVYGVSGRNVLETVSTFPFPIQFGNEKIVPLIVGGTNAVAGEFRGKVSVNDHRH